MAMCALSVQGLVQGTQSAAFEKIRNTDLRELCEPLLTAQACASAVFTSTPACQFPDDVDRRTSEFLMMIRAMNITLNYVCRDNVDVVNEHKSCLLQPGGPRGMPILIPSVGMRCRQQLQGAPGSHCPPPGAVDCVSSVISEQCGGVIASHVQTLASKVLDEINCAERKRSKMAKKQLLKQLFTDSKSEKMAKKDLYSPLQAIQKTLYSLF